MKSVLYVQFYLYKNKINVHNIYNNCCFKIVNNFEIIRNQTDEYYVKNMCKNIAFPFS